MASPFFQEAERRALSQMAEAGFTPSGLERYKLDRLRELRAVIDSLRWRVSRKCSRRRPFRCRALPERNRRPSALAPASLLD